MGLGFDIHHNKKATNAVERIQDDAQAMQRLYQSDTLIVKYEYPLLTDTLSDATRNPSGFEDYNVQLRALCHRLIDLTQACTYRTAQLRMLVLDSINVFQFELLWPGYRSTFTDVEKTFIRGGDRKYQKQLPFFFKDIKVNLEWILNALIEKNVQATTQKEKADFQFWMNELIEGISVCEGGVYDELYRIRQWLSKPTGLYAYLATIRYEIIYKMASQYVDIMRRSDPEWLGSYEKHTSRFLCALAERFSIHLPKLSDDDAAVDVRFHDRYAPSIMNGEHAHTVRIYPQPNNLHMTTHWANGFLERFYKQYTPIFVLNSLSSLFQSELSNLHMKASADYQQHADQVAIINAALQTNIESYLRLFGAGQVDVKTFMNVLNIENGLKDTATLKSLCDVTAAQALAKEKVIKGLDYKTLLKSTIVKRDESNKATYVEIELMLVTADTVQWFERVDGGLHEVRDAHSVMTAFLMRNDIPLFTQSLAHIQDFALLDGCINSLHETRENYDSDDEDDKDELLKIDAFHKILMQKKHELKVSYNMVVLLSGRYEHLMLEDMDDLIAINPLITQGNKELVSKATAFIMTRLSVEADNKKAVDFIMTNESVKVKMVQSKTIPEAYLTYLNSFDPPSLAIPKIPQALRPKIPYALLRIMLKTHGDFVDFFTEELALSNLIAIVGTGDKPGEGDIKAQLINQYFSGDFHIQDHRYKKHYYRFLGELCKASKINRRVCEHARAEKVPYVEVMNSYFNVFITSFEKIFDSIRWVSFGVQETMIQYYLYAMNECVHDDDLALHFSVKDLYMLSSVSDYHVPHVKPHVSQLSSDRLAHCQSFSQLFGRKEDYQSQIDGLKTESVRIQLRDNGFFTCLMECDLASIIQKSPLQEIIDFVKVISESVTDSETSNKSKKADAIDFIDYLLRLITGHHDLMSLLNVIHPCHLFSIDRSLVNGECDKRLLTSVNDRFYSAVTEADDLTLFIRFRHIKPSLVNGSYGASMLRGRILAKTKIKYSTLFVDDRFKDSLNIMMYCFLDKIKNTYVDWLEKDGKEYYPESDDYIITVQGVDVLAEGYKPLFEYIVNESTNPRLISLLRNPRISISKTKLDRAQYISMLMYGADFKGFFVVLFNLVSSWLDASCTNKQKMYAILDLYKEFYSKLGFRHQWTLSFRNKFLEEGNFNALITSIVYDELNDPKSQYLELIYEALPPELTGLRLTVFRLKALATGELQFYDPCKESLSVFFELMECIAIENRGRYTASLSSTFFTRFLDKEPNSSVEAKQWLDFLVQTKNHLYSLHVPIAKRYAFFDKYLFLSQVRVDAQHLIDLLRSHVAHVDTLRQFYATQSEKSLFLYTVMNQLRLTQSLDQKGVVALVFKLIKDHPTDFEGIMLTLHASYWGDVLVALGIYPQDQHPDFSWVDDSQGTPAHQGVHRITSRYDALQEERRRANRLRNLLKREPQPVVVPLMDKLKDVDQMMDNKIVANLEGVKLQLARHFAAEYQRRLQETRYQPSDLTKAMV